MIRFKIIKLFDILLNKPNKIQTTPCYFARSPLLSVRRKNLELVEEMSTVEELEQERQILEEKVRVLVDKLELKKGPTEIKMDKSYLFKTKEDAASMPLENLNINEKPSTESSSICNKSDKQFKATTGEQQSGESVKGKSAPAKDLDKPTDVSRLDLRIGRILDVNRHPDADSLYVEKIDCGDASGPRTVISGLVKHVPIEDMMDRYVVVLCNLKPAKMRGILSEAMVMCASTPDKVELLQPPENVKPGDRVVFDNYPGEPDAQLNPKKKIWEQISPDIKTNEDGVAMYKECEFKIMDVDGKFKSNLKNVQIR